MALISRRKEEICGMQSGQDPTEEPKSTLCPAPASLSSAGEVEAGTTVGGGGPNEGVLGMLAGSELATTGIDRSKALPLTSNRPSMIVPQSEVVRAYSRYFDAHATHHLGTGIPHFVPIITAFLLLLVEFLTQAFTIS
ncbi:hypothetical protein B0H13DRAFT_1895117 [Mycena leptocephala]|nr:hypothetical protein B0H13DRAFT_1895117 [Mycena leptocephala]